MTGNSGTGSNVSIALIHHPVFDKNRRVVTTAVTNLDLHDIARAARTYGLFRYFVVTPIPEQQQLAKKIGSHWLEGFGGSYNPARKSALELMKVVTSLEAVIGDIEESFGRKPKIVATGADGRPGSIRSSELAEMVKDLSQPYLILFGTGWGLADEVFKLADLTLEPIVGAGDYNHLSVRSAAAIFLDRLLGMR